MFTISKKLLAATVGAAAIAVVSGATPAMAQAKPDPFRSPVSGLLADASDAYYGGILDPNHCRSRWVQAQIDRINADIKQMEDYMDRVHQLIQQSKGSDWPTDDQRINDLMEGYKHVGYDAWRALQGMKYWLAELEKMPPCVVTPPPSQVSPGPTAVPQTPTQLNLPVLPLVPEPPIRIEDTFPDHPRRPWDEKTGTDHRSDEKVDTGGDRREGQSSAHRTTESRSAESHATESRPTSTTRANSETKPTVQNQKSALQNHVAPRQAAVPSRRAAGSSRTGLGGGTHMSGLGGGHGFGGMHGLGGMRMAGLGGGHGLGGMHGLGGLHMGGFRRH
jgi:hypothetical protein